MPIHHGLNTSEKKLNLTGLPQVRLNGMPKIATILSKYIKNNFSYSAKLIICNTNKAHILNLFPASFPKLETIKINGNTAMKWVSVTKSV